MADSVPFQPIKHQWIELAVAGSTDEFLLQNKSRGTTMHVAVAAAQPTVPPTTATKQGEFELVGGASMNRLDEGAHWVWVWDHIEPAALVIQAA